MKFEKVSFDEFRKNFGQTEAAQWAYNNVQLPRRGTPGSAGYDFYLPVPVCLSAGVPTVIPTGIRVQIDPGWFLMCVPRSGLGFKYGLKLRNTTGIIDEDFWFADNEGHIMASIISAVPVSLKEGDRFMQGIFVPYGITEGDSPINRERRGGLGSTGGTGEAR